MEAMIIQQRRLYADIRIRARKGIQILMRKALIIGGGPAGLTAAYELLKASETDASAEKFEVLVFEESSQLGGISKTVEYNGNRMDMGGHRFFSKDPKVNEWWNQMLPLQGAPAYDDIFLQRTPPLARAVPIRKRRTGSCLPGTGCPGFTLTGNFLTTRSP